MIPGCLVNSKPADYCPVWNAEIGNKSRTASPGFDRICPPKQPASLFLQYPRLTPKEKSPPTFWQAGLSIEVVACGTGLSIEEIQQLQQQINYSHPK